MHDSKTTWKVTRGLCPSWILRHGTTPLRFWSSTSCQRPWGLCDRSCGDWSGAKESMKATHRGDHLSKANPFVGYQSIRLLPYLTWAMEAATKTSPGAESVDHQSNKWDAGVDYKAHRRKASKRRHSTLRAEEPYPKQCDQGGHLIIYSGSIDQHQACCYPSKGIINGCM